MLLRQTLRTGLLKTVDEALDTLQEDGKVNRFGIVKGRLDGLQENLTEIQQKGSGPLGMGLLERFRESAAPPEPLPEPLPVPLEQQLTPQEREALEKFRVESQEPGIGRGLVYSEKLGRIRVY